MGKSLTASALQEEKEEARIKAIFKENQAQGKKKLAAKEKEPSKRKPQEEVNILGKFCRVTAKGPR